MILLHRIGERVNSNFNTIEEILDYKGLISFDGIYEEVWNHREQLRGKKVTLFFCGDHTGGDNSFDEGQPPGKFITMDQLLHLRDHFGFRLGYHSRTHRVLTDLSDEEVRAELVSPIKCDLFAYPHGNVDLRVAKLVKMAGYKEAWSVTQGDDSQFQRKRSYLNW